MTIHEKPQNLAAEKIPVIDVDFHPMPRQHEENVLCHLPERWRTYIAKYGLGVGGSSFTGSPAQRQFTHRLDAVDKNGKVGVDPLFAKAQVLDKYDLSAAVLTCVSPNLPCGPNRSAELGIALNRAFNETIAHTWLTADPRYYSAISIARDLPGIESEIRRCKEGGMGDRFVEVLISPSGMEPLGKERYWPLFQACVDYDLPLACHVPAAGAKVTAGGAASFYSEFHMNIPSLPMTTLASLVFEGIFERFPKLKIAFIELGWSWAPMFMWRMDATFEKLRGELPHLKRKPSEYVREHVWFATQPVEEPERSEHLESVFRMFEESGLGDHLMYSSDYPHWDFDSPYDSMPAHHPIDRRRRILGETASKLYKIPLRENTGILAHGRPL